MKLNKLLTPMLGLATVSTIVAPLATSCTTEETTTDHIKISNKSEEVTPNSSGVANYLFVLDSNEYDEHGFKVSTTVNEKDTSGVVDSDFTTTWEIDGDHLLVHVAYEGEAEAPEDDVAIKLNIHINYGSEWNKTFDVKFNYVAQKGIELEYEQNGPRFTTTDTLSVEKGKSYTLVIDFSKTPSGTGTGFEGCSYFFQYSSSTKPKPTVVAPRPYFEDITMVVNTTTFVKDTDYGLSKSVLPDLPGYYQISLTKPGWEKIDAMSKPKIYITFKNCTGIYNVDDGIIDSALTYPRFY